MANFDSLRTVSKAELQKPIAVVSRRREPEIKRALGTALGWPELVLPV